MVVVDFRFGLRVANVPPPWSLLSYPAIGFVVEVVFHAPPLALLAALPGLGFAKSKPQRLAWAGVSVVSLLELTFRLCVFRSFGFVSMYSLRLLYYVCWHISWGWVRLHLS